VADDEPFFPCPICRERVCTMRMTKVPFIDRRINSLSVRCPNHRITADKESFLKRRAIKQSRAQRRSEHSNLNMHSNTNSNGGSRNTIKSDSKRKRKRSIDDLNAEFGDKSSIALPDPPSSKRLKLEAMDGDGMMCEWTGSLSDLKKHILSCPLQLISCDYCKHKVIRSELGQHHRECRKYPMECKLCGHRNISRDCMDYHSKHHCPMELIECAHCRGKIKRKHRLKHQRTVCPETRIACTFKSMGCDAMVKRKDIGKHNKSSTAEHLGIVMNLVMEQRDTIRGLTARVRKLEGGSSEPDSDGSDDDNSDSDQSCWAA